MRLLLGWLSACIRTASGGSGLAANSSNAAPSYLLRVTESVPRSP